ncbi:MAG TPA: hypothetical protein VE076_10665 [Nitrososphaeraceae archaeon]|nr:hypothetical protein [Nitrososphaeraceae archaeon]
MEEHLLERCGAKRASSLLFFTYPPLTITTITSFFAASWQGEAEGIGIMVVVEILTPYRA